MKKHLRYLAYVARHKWFVFWSARGLGIAWLGLIHDWSKFSPDEWRPYCDHFYGRRAGTQRDETGYYKPTDTGDAAFDYAWLLHQKRNRHHWQWWILPCDTDGTKVLAMPDRYRREMVADWRGASRAQGHGGDVRAWYRRNGAKMQLAPETRRWVEEWIGAEAAS